MRLSSWVLAFVLASTIGMLATVAYTRKDTRDKKPKVESQAQALS